MLYLFKATLVSFALLVLFATGANASNCEKYAAGNDIISFCDNPDEIYLNGDLCSVRREPDKYNDMRTQNILTCPNRNELVFATYAQGITVLTDQVTREEHELVEIIDEKKHTLYKDFRLALIEAGWKPVLNLEGDCWINPSRKLGGGKTCADYPEAEFCSTADTYCVMVWQKSAVTWIINTEGKNFIVDTYWDASKPPTVAPGVRLDLAGMYGDTGGCSTEFTGEGSGFRLLSDQFIAHEWGCSFKPDQLKELTSRSKIVGWKVETVCWAEGNEWEQEFTVLEDRTAKVAFVINDNQVLVGDLCSMDENDRINRDTERYKQKIRPGLLISEYAKEKPRVVREMPNGDFVAFPAHWEEYEIHEFVKEKFSENNRPK